MQYDLSPPPAPRSDQHAHPHGEGTWAAAAERAQTVAAATMLPQVSVHGLQTRVFVPMAGAGDGLRQYELTTPGIAITLPRARSRIPIDNYNIQRGIVRRVWLRRDGAGVQVRVITRRAPARTIVSYDEPGLTFVLEP